MALLFFYFFFQAEDGIRDHCVTGVQTCALPISSAALREATHVALGAALDEGELRSAVGAGANEVLRGPGALTGGPLGSGDARLDGSRSGRHRAAQEVLLDALLLLHPFLDRDPDRVGNREHFVRPEPADPVGRDAPQLAIHLAERDARAQRE